MDEKDYLKKEDELGIFKATPIGCLTSIFLFILVALGWIYFVYTLFFKE